MTTSKKTVMINIKEASWLKNFKTMIHSTNYEDNDYRKSFTISKVHKSLYMLKSDWRELSPRKIIMKISPTHLPFEYHLHGWRRKRKLSFLPSQERWRYMNKLWKTWKKTPTRGTTSHLNKAFTADEKKKFSLISTKGQPLNCHHISRFYLHQERSSRLWKNMETWAEYYWSTIYYLHAITTAKDHRQFRNSSRKPYPTDMEQGEHLWRYVRTSTRRISRRQLIRSRTLKDGDDSPNRLGNRQYCLIPKRARLPSNDMHRIQKEITKTSRIT